MIWLQGLVAGGAWVHVFPEGHVGYSGRLEPCRWGVGRLVCDAAVAAGRCGMHQTAAAVASGGFAWSDANDFESQLPRCSR